jgi:hypothetical protein
LFLSEKYISCSDPNDLALLFTLLVMFGAICYDIDLLPIAPQISAYCYCNKFSTLRIVCIRRFPFFFNTQSPPVAAMKPCPGNSPQEQENDDLVVLWIHSFVDSPC